MLIENYFAPRFQIGIARTSRICFHDWKHKMQIGMLQSLPLQTSRTSPTTVFLRSIRTIKVLGIGQSQLQFANAGNTREELRVRNTPFTHRLTKLLLRSLLPYDVPKKHAVA